MTDSGNRRVLFAGFGAAFLIGILVCVVAWRTENRLVGDWGFPLDDSWIHCQIARNLAQDHEWTYNRHVPVQNSSGPIWTALVAVGFQLFGVNVWVVKILGALCFLLCIALTGWLALIWSRDRIAAIVAAIFAATSVPMAWHALSGMETILAAVCVAATLAAHARWRTGRRRWIWPVLLALGVMARPETLVLLPILSIERWRSRHEVGHGVWWRDVLVAAGIVCLVLAPYFILNLKLSGALFPTTFAAKAGNTGLAFALRNRDPLEILLSATLYPYAWTVHAISYWGRLNVAALLAAAIGSWTLARGPRPALAPALLLLALPALRGVTAPHVLPAIQEGRYIGALLPVYYACAAVGLLSLLRAGAAHWRATRRQRWILTSVALLGVLAWIRLELLVPHVGPGFLPTLPTLVVGGQAETPVLGKLHFEQMGLFLIVTGALALLGLLRASPPTWRRVGLALAMLAGGIQLTRLPRLPRNYAQGVKDIHVMDVELGRWVKQHFPPETRIAVNDIGAIAFFGERPIIDAIGLATPELIPYWSPRRVRTLIGLRRLQPSYCIVFTNWFPEWNTFSSLFVPIHEHRVPRSTTLGGSVAAIYRLDWNRFSSYYTDEMISKLDPPEAYASFQGHLKRGLGNLGLPTRSRLFTAAGDWALQQQDLATAERCYKRSAAIDPRDLSAWAGLYNLYMQQRRFTDLRRTILQMVKAAPESPSNLELLGDSMANQGRAEEARACYQQALDLQPDKLHVLEKLERVLTMQGLELEAAAIRTRRLELDPRHGSDPTPSE